MKSFFVKGVEVKISVNHIGEVDQKKFQLAHVGTVVDCDSQFVCLLVKTQGFTDKHILIPFSRIVTAECAAPAIKSKKGK